MDSSAEVDDVLARLVATRSTLPSRVEILLREALQASRGCRIYAIVMVPAGSVVAAKRDPTCPIDSRA